MCFGKKQGLSTERTGHKTEENISFDPKTDKIYIQIVKKLLIFVEFMIESICVPFISGRFAAEGFAPFWRNMTDIIAPMDQEHQGGFYP